MSNILTYKSPAKLNLFLHITGRRPDGYHQLQTVFQLIDLCDILTFDIDNLPQGVLSLRCDQPEVPLDDNLVFSAASVLRDAVGRPDLAASVTLQKRIPMGAGLGGGSSNAAITLLALNQLWNLGLSIPRLMELGLGLGADVPVFVLGRSAWAEGVGEELEPLELPPLHFLIIQPPVHIATADIFADQQLTRDSAAIKIADFLPGGGRNDCENVVRRQYPEVDEAMNWLNQFAPARLTGTGSCVFTSFDRLQEAEALLKKVPAGFRGFVASGLNQLPVPQRA